MSYPSGRSVSRAACAVLVAVGATVGLATVLSATSCTDTVVVDTSLISGISINTNLLLNGLGCSNEASADVYKYVAIAINNEHDIAGAGIFDCFADGVFGDLPGTDGGALRFAVWIYAYNPADFAAANTDNALVNAVATLNGVNQIDGSVVPVATNIVPEGGTTKKGYPAALSTVCLRKATWVATCSSTAQATVLAPAACSTLQLEQTTPNACVLPVLLPDGSADAH